MLFDEVATGELPTGLLYIPHFIDEKKEAELISNIDAQPWLADLKRRVQHYGYRYDYKARNLSSQLKLGNIPVWLLPYADALKIAGYFAQVPDQVIINEYEAGQGIAPHIDCEPCFGKTIASLSLGSPCVMDFMHVKTRNTISLLLEPRSLLIISGATRYEWQHGIAHRKTDSYNGQKFVRTRRVSLTFRNVIL